MDLLRYILVDDDPDDPYNDSPEPSVTGPYVQLPKADVMEASNIETGQRNLEERRFNEMHCSVRPSSVMLPEFGHFEATDGRPHRDDRGWAVPSQQQIRSNAEVHPEYETTGLLENQNSAWRLPPVSAWFGKLRSVPDLQMIQCTDVGAGIGNEGPSPRLNTRYLQNVQTPMNTKLLRPVISKRDDSQFDSLNTIYKQDLSKEATRNSSGGKHVFMFDTRDVQLHSETAFSKQKTYTCTVCDAKFSQHCMLAKHFKIHTNSNVCDMFGTSFNQVQGSSGQQYEYSIQDGDNFVQGHYPTVLGHTVQEYDPSVQEHGPFIDEYFPSIEKHNPSVQEYNPFIQDQSLSVQGPKLIQGQSTSIHEYFSIQEQNSFELDPVPGPKPDSQEIATSNQIAHAGKPSKKLRVPQKEISRKYKLSVHTRIMTQNGAFTCHVCNKGFAKNQALACHFRVHTRERRTNVSVDKKASECKISKGHRFCRKELLANARSCTQDKPYICDKCRKGFRSRPGLARHAHVHDKEIEQGHFSTQGLDHSDKGSPSQEHYPVGHYSTVDKECNLLKVNEDICQKKCILSTHAEMCTQQSVYLCDVCGKGFASKRGLACHSRVHKRRPIDSYSHGHVSPVQGCNHAVHKHNDSVERGDEFVKETYKCEMNEKHRVLQEKITYSCDVCLRLFPTKHGLACHSHVHKKIKRHSSIQSHISPVGGCNHSIQDFKPSLQKNNPSVQLHCPSVEEHCPSVQEHCPSVQEHCPSVQEHCPSVQEHCPSVQEHCPSVQDHKPSVQEHKPSVQEHKPSVQEHKPSVQEHKPSVQEHNPSAQKNDESIRKETNTWEINENRRVQEKFSQKTYSCDVCLRDFPTKRRLACHSHVHKKIQSHISPVKGHDHSIQDLKPVQEYNASPLQEYNPSPLQEYNPPPLQEYTPPLQEYTPSPLQEYTPSPLQEYNPSPLQEYNPSPLQEYNPSPLQEYKPPPLQEYKPSLQEHNSCDKEHIDSVQHDPSVQKNDESVRKKTNTYEMNEKQRVHEEEIPQNGYSCDVCHRGFCTKRGLACHCHVHKTIQTDSSIQSHSSLVGGCDNSIKDVKPCLQEHTDSVEHDISVQRGDASVNKKTDIWQMNKKQEFPQEFHSCDMCLRDFRSKRGLALHLHAHTKKKIHRCKVCNKTFPEKSDLVKHSNVHKKTYECSSCNEQYYRKRDLAIHLERHAQTFKCSCCKRSFLKKCHLDVHERTHTMDRPYTCGICKWTFSQKQNLASHMRVHTKERPFICLTCNRRFSQKQAIARHLGCHVKKRQSPFTCELCDTKHHNKAEFLEHLKIHVVEDWNNA